MMTNACLCTVAGAGKQFAESVCDSFGEDRSGYLSRGFTSEACSWRQPPRKYHLACRLSPPVKVWERSSESSEILKLTSVEFDNSKKIDRWETFSRLSETTECRTHRCATRWKNVRKDVVKKVAPMPRNCTRRCARNTGILKEQACETCFRPPKHH